MREGGENGCFANSLFFFSSSFLFFFLKEQIEKGQEVLQLMEVAIKAGKKHAYSIFIRISSLFFLPFLPSFLPFLLL